jgi:hypothetical protein
MHLSKKKMHSTKVKLMHTIHATCDREYACATEWFVQAALQCCSRALEFKCTAYT